VRESLVLSFVSPCGSYELTFEDDEKVAYAYLKNRAKGTIIGDVWLFNRCPTPIRPEWTDRNKIPSANSEEYVGEQGRLEREVRGEDVLVNWEYENEHPVAYVYIFEDLYGVVGAGDKPGYARLARKSSRLARVIEITD
jgi:hypothetical protein